jgi:hypothetical protein
MLVEHFGHPSVFSTSREAIYLQNKLPYNKNYHDITNLYPTITIVVTVAVKLREIIIKANNYLSFYGHGSLKNCMHA